MKLPHTSVGRYELLLLIGRGGVGSVYLARYAVAPGVQRQVAVKLVHPSLQAHESADGASLLLREAKLASRIRHPNVVEVLEAGLEDEVVFLALDYVEGTTLHAILAWTHKHATTLPLGVAGRILSDALAGLHAAHELRDDEGRPLALVHRDFTPQNILIGSDGVTRLTDFGVAKSTQQTAVTSTGIVKGKVAYLAPEQALGRALDRRVDVWSAGVVAWEAFTGERLFRHESDAATLLAIVTPTAPARTSSRRPDCPAALDAAVSAALTHDPERRLASAESLRQRIEAALEECGGLASHREVAAWVAAVAGADLDARKAALAGRAPGVSVSSVAEPTSTTVTASSRDLEPPARARWPWLALPLALGGIAFSLLDVSLLDSARPLTPLRAWPRLPMPPEAPPMAATETAPPEAPPVLRIVSPTELTQIALGARTIVLATATKDIEIPLRDDEHARPLELRVTARDGRRGTARVAPGQRTVEVRLPRPQRPRPPQPGDDLADSPY